MVEKEVVETSEAQIAVHWQEEEYYYPSTEFIAQANMTDAGVFEGGIVQRIQVEPGAEYRLTSTMKYETRLPRSLIGYWIGYDLSGQFNDSGADTIEWTADLIESESRETDIWYTQTLEFTAIGNSVSIWFAGSQREGEYPFRISLDTVSLEKIDS